MDTNAHFENGAKTFEGENSIFQAILGFEKFVEPDKVGEKWM